jgi:hypothetical protein
MDLQPATAIPLPAVIPDVPLPPSADPAAVREWAEGVIGSFGLSDWRFEIGRAVRRLGVCRYRTRTIGVSAFVLDQPHELRNTLLHEIAHALVGPRQGHGPVWRAMARRIGARPERCNTTAVVPKGKWQANCHGCQRVAHRHRKPKRLNGWFCRACGPRIGRLIWYRAEGTT